MEADIKILNNIFKITEMGVIGIDHVITKIKDPVLEKIFIDQKKEYNLIKIESEKLLNELAITPDGLPMMAEMGSNIMTSMELLKDGSDSNITKMMIEGTNKGIVELNTILNAEEATNKKVIALSEQLLNLMEHNINDLKKYL